MVIFVEFFCHLIRKLGGADLLRKSLKQFDMREDGTIEREWFEGKNPYVQDLEAYRLRAGGPRRLFFHLN